METLFGVPIVLIIWWIIWMSRSTNDSVEFISEADNSYTQASNLNIDDKLSVFARLAREGHASALASYTWVCLEHERHSDAIALYDETRKSLTKDAGNRLGWELANCDSNQALNLMATGTPLEDVKSLWERNQNMNHNECLFYSKLVGIREGKLQKSEISKLPGAVKRDLRATLNQGKSTTGWYKAWCSDVLEEFGGML